MDNPFLEILIILLLIIINGVFSMSEIAIVSSRKVRLQQKADDGDKDALAALALTEEPNRFLSTVQIGITLIGTLTGALGGATLANRLALILATIEPLEPYAVGISFALIVIATTYFQLVLGELIPKRLGMNNPDGITLTVSRPMQFLSKITSPLVSLLSSSTDLGLRLLGVKPSEEPPVTEEEIKVFIEQGTQSGIFEAAEQDMIESVFRLADRYIDAIMTPRTEIEWIDLDQTNAEIMADIRASNHSRFPAAHDNLDDVQGILSAKDFLDKMLTGENFDTQPLLQTPLFVPDSMSALKVLEMIRASGVHEALVIDEYGGLLGMVTLYDILRAIVGDLPTAGEGEEPQIITRDDGSWLLDGLLSIDDFKDLTETEKLPGEDRIGFQTLGGFILSYLGNIPQVGQTFDWQNLHFEIMDMDGRRIDKILVRRLPESDPSPVI
jgi:putative hemolysin